MASYLDRISQSKDDKAKASAKRTAEEAAQQLNVDVFTTKRNISDVEGKIEDAKSQTPFNAGNIIQLERTLALAEEDLAALTALQSELFPG